MLPLPPIIIIYCVLAVTGHKDEMKKSGSQVVLQKNNQNNTTCKIKNEQVKIPELEMIKSIILQPIILRRFAMKSRFTETKGSTKSHSAKISNPQ